jgi:hypothetical protein
LQRVRPAAAVKGTGEKYLMRRLTVAWALLVMNVLTYAPTSILPIPGSVGKLITQGSLSVAFLIALTINPKVVLRPSIYLCLTTLLALEAVLTLPMAPYLRGTSYRTFRFVEFAAVLWLLSPYFGRRDLLFARLHLKVMTWIVVSLTLGLIISPGRALGNNGRLQGIIWPIVSTQAAHYSAIALGLTVMFWFCGMVSGRRTVIMVVVSGALLLLTHTRTALLACVCGLVIGGLSLIVTNPRVRKLFLTLVIAGTVASMSASSAITSWVERGQSSNGQLTNLSGRTNFWGPLLALPRTRFEEIFGHGVSNGLFNGLPVDSNWMLSYQDQGLFGVVVCALILIFLLLTAFFETRNHNRALALFLTTYCLVASFTEVGFTSASAYSLDLTVAASLLVANIGEAKGIHQRFFHANRMA